MSVVSKGGVSAGTGLLISCPFRCRSWLCKAIRSPVIQCWSVSYSCCAGTADGTRWRAEAWSGPRSLYGNFSQEFLFFFFFKWPRYKSLKMAVDNGNADSTVAVVTVALRWLWEERIGCCQQMTTFFNFRNNSLDVLTLFTLLSVHSCLSAECQGQLKN